MLKVNVIQLSMLIVLLLASVFSILFVTSNEQNLETLLKELRCMTCPNQNIADSFAPVACAMREEITQRYQQGESATAIRQSMLSKYGDYLSYRPFVKRQTYLLWFTPILMLGIGLMVWFGFLKKGNRHS